jgi:hypothetical protein
VLTEASYLVGRIAGATAEASFVRGIAQAAVLLHPVDYRIRDRALSYESNPATKDGSGYPGDKALALAAVEVIEGQPRALARSRRRSV